MTVVAHCFPDGAGTPTDRTLGPLHRKGNRFLEVHRRPFHEGGSVP